MPEFSIITPVRNQASTIEATIRSVAEQNVDVEHIIIDGGSTDGTVEIIKAHETKLAYWVSEKDSGQPEAINKGLSRAKGKFFNWLNGDDVLVPNGLARISAIKSEHTDVIVGMCEHIDQEEKTLAVGSAKVWPTAEATLGNYSMGQPSVFYRTSVVRDLGGINQDLQLCMDMDLWFRYILKHGIEKIASSKEVISKFLVHIDSKSEAQAEQMRAEKYGIYKALLTTNSGCMEVDRFLEPLDLDFKLSYNSALLNQGEILANFAWHLLVDAYQKKNFGRAQELFETVQKGSRLSTKEQLEWKARLASAKLINR